MIFLGVIFSLRNSLKTLYRAHLRHDFRKFQKNFQKYFIIYMLQK